MIPRDGSAYDAAVIGAGIVGTAAALSFAERGARVLLLEAHPEAASRLAGEWLHPPGVDVLSRLGIDLASEGRGATVGRGFVVFPDDRSEPIVLPYPNEARGVSWEHRRFVGRLRERAALHPLIDIRLGALAQSVGPGWIGVKAPQGRGSVRIEASRVVGADGRSSIVRRALGLGGDATTISWTAGVELHDVELPFEEYGHLILGGPGPAFVYRVGPGRVRASLDVPSGLSGGARGRGPEGLRAAFFDVLPSCLRGAFSRAIATGRVQWAAAGFRPRAHYGAGRVVLAGDAVGHFHPMTAAGMSLGLADAESVAASSDVEAYRRDREAASWVPELLACALYQALTRTDPGGVAIRQAIYRLWRTSAGERQRTMGLLACSETRAGQFRGAFQAVLWDIVRKEARLGWRTMPRAIADLGEWIRWPAASAVPKTIRRLTRARSTPAHPLWGGWA